MNISIKSDHKVVSRIIRGEVRVVKCHLYETTDELNQRATEKVQESLLEMGKIQDLDHVWDIALTGPWHDYENNDVELFDFEYTVVESKEDYISDPFPDGYIPGNSPSLQPPAPFDSCGHHNETMNMCSGCGYWMCQNCEPTHVCIAVEDVEDNEEWLESLEELEDEHLEDEW